MIPILDWRPKCCQWIDPKAEKATYCDADKCGAALAAPGASYCVAHEKRAYTEAGYARLQKLRSAAIERGTPGG